MTLVGRNVSHIRNSGAYSEHKVNLEELGFVFKKNKKKVMEIVWSFFKYLVKTLFP